MRLHGNLPPPEPQKAGPRLSAVTGVRYRHLFGRKRLTFFRGHGFGPGELPRTEGLLKALAYRMCGPYEWADRLPGARSNEENTNLPSGYTYLLQLVAHDMSFVGTARADIAEDPFRTSNLRTSALKLDTLYGGGLLGGPTSAYCRAAGALGRRPTLRLGCFRARNGSPSLAEVRARARDLPRSDRSFPGDEGSGFGDVLVADPRNDDQPIIAQTLVLFALLHNAVCERLESVGAPNRALSAQSLFEAAQFAVISVYLRIIELDLLQRLLNRAIYQRYVTDGADLLDEADEDGLPVEFSHGAFRIGHAMVRDGYTFNRAKEVDHSFGLPAILQRNSVQQPTALPLDAPWAVEWSQFYDLDGTPANLSHRLGPSVAPALFEGSEFGGAALTHLDLRRGARELRSLESFLDVLPPDLTALSPLLDRKPDARAAAVARWLAQKRSPHPNCESAVDLTVDDQEVLARDPPLLFFVLLEAAAAENGERLGVLGSIIVAETICPMLRQRPLAPPPSAAKVDLPSLFDGSVPDSMADLVHFLQRHYAFADGDFPFS